MFFRRTPSPHQAPPDMSAPPIECTRLNPTLRVRDVARAIDFYTSRLGFRLGFKWGEPLRFAGMNFGEVQVFLQQGDPGSVPAQVYFVVDDADALHEYQAGQGAQVLRTPADQAYELRDYTVADLDGNELTFGHYTPSREPALEIERVDVPVRLERRLAALLEDLARHKGMTVGNCLEETLLHTFEPLDGSDGVASPHTKSDLRYIASLKARHGIDYDCHASYRFVERGEKERGDGSEL
jgi:catechol 2,3-dioxygenase-like lactoylglutathione lyase family enzyme